jgi:hypothetical protein
MVRLALPPLQCETDAHLSAPASAQTYYAKSVPSTRSSWSQKCARRGHLRLVRAFGR